MNVNPVNYGMQTAMAQFDQLLMTLPLTLQVNFLYRIVSNRHNMILNQNDIIQKWSTLVGLQNVPLFCTHTHTPVQPNCDHTSLV